MKILAAAAACVGFTSISLGATWTWDGGSGFGPDSMSQSGNWSPASVPVSGGSDTVLIFPAGADSFTPNQNIATPFSLQSMLVTGGAYQFTSGSGYSFSNLGAAPTISTPAATTVFGTLMSFGASTAWTLNGPVNMNGQMSGGGNVNVSALATSQFSFGGGGINFYSGTFSMNNGTLNLARAGTALSGGLNASNMTVNVNAANQFGVNSDITLNNTELKTSTSQQLRDLRVDNGSSVNVTGSPTITLNGNLVSFGGFNSIGNNPMQTLNLAGGVRLFNINAAPGDQTVINMTITNGRFNKIGNGMLQLGSTTSTYTGQNVVSAGTLYTSASGIGTDVQNNASIRFYGGNLPANCLSGSGSVTIENAVVYSGPQSYTGNTLLLTGATLVGASDSFSGNIVGVGALALLSISQPTPGTLAANISGATMLSKDGAGVMTVTGNNTHTGDSFITEGGVNIASNAPFGSGMLLLGNTATPLGVEATGTRIVNNPLLTPGILTLTGSGDLRFSDSTAKTFNWPVTHNSAGTTTFDGKLTMSAGGMITVNSGTMVVGSSAVANAFATAAPVVINGGTLVVRSLNFSTLPDVTLAGGALNAPNGYAIPLGAVLQGAGAVTGRVASANGSSILASGNLALGDSSHPAGVSLDGELYANNNTVTLLDSNSAVLGSYTQLGNGISGGTLASANGVVLNFGRNIVGRGTVSSGNSLAAASIINGDVNGDSLTNFIEFTGYVKGVGNFNNVAFSGTFAPGLSPTLLTLGNVILTPSNVLDMELGGLLRGGQYDAFNITGTLVLDGQLKLSLINSFTPAAGDQFDLFDGTTAGTFSSFNYPPLTAGLVWDNSLLYTQGIVQVNFIPEPAALASMVVGALGLLARRRAR